MIIDLLLLAGGVYLLVQKLENRPDVQARRWSESIKAAQQAEMGRAEANRESRKNARTRRRRAEVRTLNQQEAFRNKVREVAAKEWRRVSGLHESAEGESSDG